MSPKPANARPKRLSDRWSVRELNALTSVGFIPPSWLRLSPELWRSDFNARHLVHCRITAAIAGSPS